MTQPTTAAGLLDRWQETGQWPPSPEPRGGWTPPRLYEAIAEEVRADLIKRVEALPRGRISGGQMYEDSTGRFLDRAAVLALLRDDKEAGGEEDEVRYQRRAHEGRAIEASHR